MPSHRVAPDQPEQTGKGQWQHAAPWFASDKQGTPRSYSVEQARELLSSKMVQKQIRHKHRTVEPIRAQEPFIRVGRHHFNLPATAHELASDFSAHRALAIHQNRRYVPPGGRETPRDTSAKVTVARAKVDQTRGCFVRESPSQNPSDHSGMAHPPVDSPQIAPRARCARILHGKFIQPLWFNTAFHLSQGS
ncbi:MAG TPA: hypothetical protein PLU30_23865 [Verrucomicrobiae bacterium]|nr:hypothetical protein [Verrucomicrobiae bacterium]